MYCIVITNINRVIKLGMMSGAKHVAHEVVFKRVCSIYRTVSATRLLIRCMVKYCKLFVQNS